ncbi:MAG: hypothetical protein FJW14_08650 [Acidimicrobiia bacterium]|nr:hypothetical protein [Acidimicrobiia bacterium]
MRMLALVLALLVARPAYAEVTRVEIASRADIAIAGYERITGRVFFAVDPADPSNAVIADISTAPKNAQGKVEFSADFSILRPKTGGNGVALVDIPNRGGARVVPMYNRARGGASEFGDGFLMQRGFTVVLVGWQHDVAGTGANLLRIQVPGTPPVGGLGFAAVRDMASWIKYTPGAVTSARYAYSFGQSQSGRYLRDFLYHGFNTDERGRQVFDAVMPHIAGAARIDLNRRGSTPNPADSAATAFPFSDRAQRDPVSGVTEGLLDNDRARRNQPKVFYTNTDVEYWSATGRSAALVHTSVDGARDLELPDNVRAFHIAGTQHGPGAFPPARTTGQQMGNPADDTFVMRALLLAMDRWVREGIAPPPSRHSRLADRTLVRAADVAFPAIPGVQRPNGIPAASRVANTLIAGGAGAGATLPYLVPQVDADGNDRAGIRLPEIAVPLATYTGWNFGAGGSAPSDKLVNLLGSYVPFARTKAEREQRGDPRQSIAERYQSRDQYVAMTRSAAEALVRDRFMLQDDVNAVLERAGAHWDLLTAPATTSAGR